MLTDFELESGNGNVDGQTNGQMNRRNYTNFKRNLAMIVIYTPVKFEFDWTNRFRVRVRKRKCGQTDRRWTHQSNRRVGYMKNWPSFAVRWLHLHSYWNFKVARK